MKLYQYQRFLSVLSVALVATMFVGTTAESHVGRGRLMHFVEGRDILMEDGTAGFTVDRETVAVVDPHDKNELKRVAKAAWMALAATAPLELTPEGKAKYAQKCGPQTSLLTRSDPPVVDTVDGCNFGDPSCANWKTFFPGSGPVAGVCALAATNCMRKK